MNTSSIKFKLILTTVSISIIFLVTGIYSLDSLHNINTINGLNNGINTARMKYLDLRKNEKDYSLREPLNEKYFKTGQSLYISMFSENYQAASHTLDSMKQNSFADKLGITATMDSISKLLEAYHETFLKVADNTQKKGMPGYGIIGDIEKSCSSLSGSGIVQQLELQTTQYLWLKDPKIAKQITASLARLGSGKTEIPAIENCKKNYAALLAIDSINGLTDKTGLNHQITEAVHDVSPKLIRIIGIVHEASLSEVRKAEIGLIIFILIGIALSISISTAINRSVITSVNKAQYAVKKIADGNLNISIESKANDELGILLDDLQLMSDKLRDIISGIDKGSLEISSTSVSLNTTSLTISQAATQQASSVEEIASSIEEMTANIQHNAENAQRISKITETLRETLKELSSAAHESLVSIKTITDKVSIISDIAFQTNILALNAAVESARAGEHGRGFAVVASEVRKLAERSKLAADDISSLSRTSVGHTENTKVLMDELVPKIDNAIKMIDEISTSSMEQSAGVEQINNAVQQLNAVTQQNAAVSEEMVGSANELNSQAKWLNENIAYFKN